MKKLFTWALILIVGVLVVLALAGTKPHSSSSEPSSSDAASKAQDDIDAVPPVTATQLQRDYAANTVAADAKYKGQLIRISGVVQDISTDFMGDPYLTLETGEILGSPHLKFSKDHLQALSALSKGTKVTAVCTGKGDIAKTPMLDDCALH